MPATPQSFWTAAELRRKIYWVRWNARLSRLEDNGWNLKSHLVGSKIELERFARARSIEYAYKYPRMLIFHLCAGEPHLSRAGDDSRLQ
jgi:hypothetical protein